MFFHYTYICQEIKNPFYFYTSLLLWISDALFIILFVEINLHINYVLIEALYSPIPLDLLVQ